MHSGQFGDSILAVPDRLMVVAVCNMQLSVSSFCYQGKRYVQIRRTSDERICFFTQPLSVIQNQEVFPHPVCNFGRCGKNMAHISEYAEASFRTAVISVGNVTVTGVKRIAAFRKFFKSFRTLFPFFSAGIQCNEFFLQFLRNFFGAIEPGGFRYPETFGAPLLDSGFFTGISPILHMGQEGFRQFRTAGGNQCGIITGRVMPPVLRTPHFKKQCKMSLKN